MKNFLLYWLLVGMTLTAALAPVALIIWIVVKIFK